MTDQATVEVEATFFVLAWILYFFKPRATLDGQPLDIAWNQPMRYPVQPGRHVVQVWCPYLFFSTMGLNAATVDVGPGQAVSVRWRAPFFFFTKGPITVTNVAPMPAGAALQQSGYPQQPAMPQVAVPQLVAAVQPAAWLADPGGRHELRYWDGSAWTPHVSDHGVTSVDPG